jgi:hypothetical protein
MDTGELGGTRETGRRGASNGAMLVLARVGLAPGVDGIRTFPLEFAWQQP